MSKVKFTLKELQAIRAQNDLCRTIPESPVIFAIGQKLDILIRARQARKAEKLLARGEPT